MRLPAFLIDVVFLCSAIMGDSVPYLTTCHFAGPPWMGVAQSLFLLSLSVAASLSLISIVKYLHSVVGVRVPLLR